MAHGLHDCVSVPVRDVDKLPEPRIQPPPLRHEKRFNDALERIASLMTSLVAALLVVFVVVAILLGLLAAIFLFVAGRLAG